MIFSEKAARTEQGDQRGKSRLVRGAIGLVATGALLSASGLHIVPRETAQQRQAKEESRTYANDAVNDYLSSHGVGSFDETYSKANRVCAALTQNPITLQLFPKDKSITCNVISGVANISSEDGLSTLQAGSSYTPLDTLKYQPGMSCGDQSCTDVSQAESTTIFRGEGIGDDTFRVTMFCAGESPSGQQDKAARLDALTDDLTQLLSRV